MIYPIVGSKYRPPAQAILSVIPVGQELELIPEPDNEHDPNAIAVWIDGGAMTTQMEIDEVRAKFQGYGESIENITVQSWHLGYIPREIAATIHLDGPIRGRFTIGSNGGPRAEFEL